MENEKKSNSDTKNNSNSYNNVGADFFDKFWQHSWTYITSVVDVIREPVIILDKDFKVLAANEAFYDLFEVEQKNTEGKVMYDLGDGQWNIPSLRELLEDILPKDTYFKGYEVTHDFPNIGQRTIMLNARKIHSDDKTGPDSFPPIIMLAMEDITEIMAAAKQMSQYAKQLEKTLANRTKKLENKITKLERKSKSE